MKRFIYRRWWIPAFLSIFGTGFIRNKDRGGGTAGVDVVNEEVTTVGGGDEGGGGGNNNNGGCDDVTGVDIDVSCESTGIGTDEGACDGTSTISSWTFDTGSKNDINISLKYLFSFIEFILPVATGVTIGVSICGLDCCVDWVETDSTGVSVDRVILPTGRAAWTLGFTLTRGRRKAIVYLKQLIIRL